MKYNLEHKLNSVPVSEFFDCGKAEVEITGGWGQIVKLYSDDTLVATVGPWSPDENCDSEWVCILEDGWCDLLSSTAHVIEFLWQHGFGQYYNPVSIASDCIDIDGMLVLPRP